MGRDEDAERYRLAAGQVESDHCFPHRLEDLNVLQSALAAVPGDAKAWYYIGNLWYDKRRYEDAIAAWEKSRELDAAFPTVHRNLALAYFNKRKEPQKARREMEAAFALDARDARVLMELDQLYKKVGWPPAERKKVMEGHPETVEKRDDLFIEYVMLNNILGKNSKALAMIEGRRFHPWEGGEGKVSAQYVCALTELAKKAIREGRFAKAVSLLERAKEYPANIGEGKLSIAKENDIDYWMGTAYRGLKDEDNARRCFEKAAVGDDEPAGMVYYNDQPPELIFYQGLALKALGNAQDAARCFEKLVHYGQAHLHDHVRIDFFAVSLPDLLIFDEDLDKRNNIHCRFMMALGLMGQGETARAREIMDEISAMDPNYQGIIIHRELVEWAL